jgi:hypothetical protein
VSSRTVAAGFEKDCFVAVDVTTGDELCRVSCGGGHRSWSLLCGSGNSVDRDAHDADHDHADFGEYTGRFVLFVYLRDSEVRAHIVAESAGLRRRGLCDVVQGEFSGREVLSAVHVPSVGGNDAFDDGFIVSGGEVRQGNLSTPASSLRISAWCAPAPPPPPHPHTHTLKNFYL